MNIIVGFLLLFLAAEALLTLAQYFIRKGKKRPVLHVVLIVVKALCAIAFAVIVLAGPVQLRKAQPFLMAAYVALFADAAADIVITIICAARKKDPSFAVYKTVSLLCGAAFLAFGILNMEIVTPNYHEYASQKLTAEHKLVFLADLHVGSAQPFSVTEKTFAAVKDQQPEALILGGDIVDDYTTKAEMEAAFALLKDIGFPVYYVYGNHDRQGHAEYANGRQFTEEELEQAMRDNGVIILKDTFAQLAPDLLLLGREDISSGEGRADAATLVNPNPDCYLIVADHQPGEFKTKNLSVGTDLQLSGHTHAGQLFPLKWFYALIGGYVYGDYYEGDAVMNVSAGACGWRMPLRTDARCNFEVIRLVPQT